MDAEVSTHTFLTMNIEESVRFMSCEPFFFGAIILMWYTRNIFLLASNILFINWTVHMSDNLPERVQILGHTHIICITVWENRIFCCQIFCDLLLKSAFEWIFNVMQLILVKIKWHIKWKYLIQKFHDICLSYYFNFIVYSLFIFVLIPQTSCIFIPAGFFPHTDKHLAVLSQRTFDTQSIHIFGLVYYLYTSRNCPFYIRCYTYGKRSFVLF